MYRLPSDLGDHAVLGFQRSPWNGERQCAFTVNVAWYGHCEWQAVREHAPELPESPNPSNYYGLFGDLGWQERLGHLTPYSHDHWWGFGPTSDTTVVGREVLDAIRVYALPALRSGQRPQTPGDAHSRACGSPFCPSERARTLA